MVYMAWLAAIAVVGAMWLERAVVGSGFRLLGPLASEYEGLACPEHWVVFNPCVEWPNFYVGAAPALHQRCTDLREFLVGASGSVASNEANSIAIRDGNGRSGLIIAQCLALDASDLPAQAEFYAQSPREGFAVGLGTRPVHQGGFTAIDEMVMKLDETGVNTTFKQMQKASDAIFTSAECDDETRVVVEVGLSGIAQLIHHEGYSKPLG